MTRLVLFCTLALTLLPAAGPAQSTPPPGETAATDATPAPDRPTPKLNFRRGKITLSDGLADLNVPDNFGFLGAQDARKVIVDVWHNPPRTANDVIGMLVPRGNRDWAVVISYEDAGYIKDDDASKIDYATMLQTMQKATHDSNEERVKEHYPTMELVGWAEPPQYDAANKKLFWARELQIGGEQEHSLNYDMRILGRRGVLVLNAVSTMEHLGEIKDARSQILDMVNYNQGHRYADFNPKTDKVAAYGVAALVLGGIAAKAGFFKLLIPVLLAAKKFLVIGVVAVVGFFKRIFGRGEKVR